MSGSVVKTFTDERLLASNLGISFFASYRFRVAVKEWMNQRRVYLLEQPLLNSLQLQLIIASRKIHKWYKTNGHFVLPKNSNTSLHLIALIVQSIRLIPTKD